MTFVLEMPDEEVMAIEAIAQARGLSAQQYARQVLKNEVAQVADHKTDNKPISEIIAEIMADVPRKYWPNCPRMARASMTITFMAGPRETFERSFRRYVLLDRADLFR